MKWNFKSHRRFLWLLKNLLEHKLETLGNMARAIHLRAESCYLSSINNTPLEVPEELMLREDASCVGTLPKGIIYLIKVHYIESMMIIVVKFIQYMAYLLFSSRWYTWLMDKINQKVTNSWTNMSIKDKEKATYTSYSSSFAKFECYFTVAFKQQQFLIYNHLQT